jgi:hypothetical protein
MKKPRTAGLFSSVLKPCDSSSNRTRIDLDWITENRPSGSLGVLKETGSEKVPRIFPSTFLADKDANTEAEEARGKA